MGKEVFSASSYGQTLTVHQNTPTPAYTSIHIESDDGQALAVALLSPDEWLMSYKHIWRTIMANRPNIIERIESNLRYCGENNLCTWVADLHQTLYNEDYLYIGTARAAQALTEFAADTDFGVFAVVGLVQDYEQSNFGEVSTDLSNPEAIANMVGYIGGYALLNQIQAAVDEAQEMADAVGTQHDPADVALLVALFNEQSDRDMTEGELAALQRVACQWLDEHPDWWSDWQEDWA